MSHIIARSFTVHSLYVIEVTVVPHHSTSLHIELQTASWNQVPNSEAIADMYLHY